MKTSKEAFKESDIRPDDLMEEVARLFQEDIKNLLKHKDDFVRVACPACESEDSHWLYEKFGQQFELCENCGSMYTNPRPQREHLEEFYSNSKGYAYWNKYIFPKSETARRKNLFIPRAEQTLEICKRYGVHNESLLEVGAAFGIFCEEIMARKTFKKVIAVEPTPDGAASCRKKGIEVIQKPFELASTDKGVDVVASFEVIEHLFSPQDFLLKCYELLKPKGLIILTCPNYLGFDIQILKTLSDAIDAEHLNYFHPNSMKILLDRCHYEVLEITTPGKLDAELVRKRLLDGSLVLEDQPFLNQILVDDWERLGGPFQRFLSENGLSSHMWIVAQKKDPTH